MLGKPTRMMLACTQYKTNKGRTHTLIKKSNMRRGILAASFKPILHCPSSVISALRLWDKVRLVTFAYAFVPGDVQDKS